MFRRKEEGLFDSTTDINQEHDEAAETAAAPAAASYQPAAATPSFGASSAYNANTQAAPAAAAPAAAPRPNTAAPTANSFRPGAAPVSAPAPAADLTRNRLPESKPVTATPANVAPVAAAGGKTNRVLTVGNDILLKGEIATCDRLVIEGKVDATLNDVHTVEIAEGGSFKGSAQIENAEISGLFEGDLTVRGRLVIYATGKVRGKISYGEIEIERGGELTGEIKIAGAAAARSSSARKDEKVAA